MGEFEAGRADGVVEVDRKDLYKAILGASGHPDQCSKETLDRLTRAYNVSGRAPLPEKPTSDEIRVLLEKFVDMLTIPPTIKKIILVSPSFIKPHRSLLSNGWIEYGVSRHNHMWVTTGENVTFDDPEQLARLTPRGRDAVMREVAGLR